MLFLERILKLRAAKYYRGAERAIYINVTIEDKIKVRTRGLP
jgi:hypothetical protein